MEKYIKKNKWVNYILKSEISNRTYVGMTNNIRRRIRQHNGEIKKGAKATQIGRPWKIVAMIKGFSNKSMACKYEWLIKHPLGKKKHNRKYARIEGRIKAINDMFFTDYFKEKEWQLPNKIYILNEYKGLLRTEIKKNFKIKIYEPKN